MNKIETIKLDNGLTIYLYQDKRKHTTLFQLVTRFGGTTEDFIIDGKEIHLHDGIAHMLEHYLVECNKYGNFLDILGKKEMRTNASTSDTYTKYYFDTVENVEFGIKTILNCVYSPIFTKENLEKLKNPICQELRRSANNKFFHHNIKKLENCSHNIHYKTTLGSLKEIQNTTLEEIQLCYEAFYNPKNQFIVVAGNFDKEKILQVIKKEAKDLEASKHIVEKLDLQEKGSVVKKQGEIIFPTPNPYLEVTYKIPINHLSNIEQLKLTCYMQIFFKMNLGTSSPLYNKLVKNQIITTNINRIIRKIDKYLLISIGSYSNQEEVLKDEITKAIKKLNWDQKLFEIDKKNIILDIILREENLPNTVGPFIENIVDFSYPYLDTVEDIEKLNYNEFKERISSLDFSNYTITTIHNPKKGKR